MKGYELDDPDYDNKDEDWHQMMFVQWLRKNHSNKLIVFAVPNGGKRGIVEAQRMKLTGTTPGVSDLIIIFTDLSKRVCFAEMKKVKRSSTSDEQLEFLMKMDGAGHGTFIAKGVKDAIEKFNEYLHKSNPNLL